MGKVTLDPTLRAKLNGLTEKLEVHDENDKLVGVFLPLAHYQSLLGRRGIPFSEEQIEQFKKSGGGSSLAEIWKRLGA